MAARIMGASTRTSGSSLKSRALSSATSSGSGVASLRVTAQ
jgi:hypothetical protein